MNLKPPDPPEYGHCLTCHRSVHESEVRGGHCIECEGKAMTNNLTAAVDAAMVEMANISPPMRRSECERLIRAAFAASPPAPAAVDQLLCDAYEHGYVDGQNNPNGYGDKADRDKCVAGLLDGVATQQADPDRLLKDALFACIEAGGADRNYGGVLTTGDRHAWVRFTTVDANHQPETVALFESVIGKNPEAFLQEQEPVYQVTESEVIEFARLLAQQPTDPLHQNLADVTHQRDLLVEAISGAAIKAGIVRADMEIPGPALLMLADDMADCIISLNSVSPADQ